MSKSHKNNEPRDARTFTNRQRAAIGLATLVGVAFGSITTLNSEKRANKDAKAKTAQYQRDLKFVERLNSKDITAVRLSGLSTLIKKDLGVGSALPTTAGDTPYFAHINQASVDADVTLPTQAEIKSAIEHQDHAGSGINYFNITIDGLIAGGVIGVMTEILVLRRPNQRRQDSAAMPTPHIDNS